MTARDKSSLLLTTFNPMAPKRLIHVIWQDEIPAEVRDRFPRFARNRLPGASGRYPHNIPDLQINSRELATSIRRQFTHGWKLKERKGVDKRQSPRVVKEGLEIAKLRIMRTKAGVDFAIGRSMGSWSTGSREPPTLDQFRYRNFRITTFKANIRGKDLAKLAADPASQTLISYPPFKPEDLEPEKQYSIVASEGILWAVRSIKNYWTDMVAGPDIDKSDIIRDVYGVDE